LSSLDMSLRNSRRTKSMAPGLVCRLLAAIDTAAFDTSTRDLKVEEGQRTCHLLVELS
jgi:hypothetical protein